MLDLASHFSARRKSGLFIALSSLSSCRKQVFIHSCAQSFARSRPKVKKKLCMWTGVSGRIQHSRLTVMLAPRECDLSNFVSILSGRALQGTALAGAVSVTVGDTSATLAQCRNLIGFASKVLSYLHHHSIKNYRVTRHT